MNGVRNIPHALKEGTSTMKEGTSPMKGTWKISQEGWNMTLMTSAMTYL